MMIKIKGEILNVGNSVHHHVFPRCQTVVNVSLALIQHQRRCSHADSCMHLFFKIFVLIEIVLIKSLVKQYIYTTDCT